MSESKADAMRPILLGHGRPEPKHKKLRRIVKKCLHISRRGDEWSFGLQLATVAAWTGAFVVIVIIISLRSKPTRLYRLKKSIYLRTVRHRGLATYNTQISHLVIWTGVLFVLAFVLRTLYLKYKVDRSVSLDSANISDLISRR